MPAATSRHMMLSTRWLHEQLVPAGTLYTAAMAPCAYSTCSYYCSAVLAACTRAMTGDVYCMYGVVELRVCSPCAEQSTLAPPKGWPRRPP
jgi:hypothetical protein